MEAREVILPPYFKKDTMHEVLPQCINNDLTPTCGKFIFNLKHLRFLEPSGQTILSNLIEWLHENDCKISISCKNYTSSDPWTDNKNVMQFLSDIKFFSKYMKEEIIEPIGPRKNTCPLEVINSNESINWTRNKFIPWLGSILHMEVTDLSNIQVSLEEIFNNVIDHSTVKQACIAAQYYPKIEKIKICVSDFGVGIPKTLKDKFPDFDDSKILVEASKHGVSSFSSPGNRGAGIDNIIKSITYDNLGVVHLQSNHGILNVSCDRMESSLSEFYYPGTFYEFVIDADIVKETSNPEEEFVW